MTNQSVKVILKSIEVVDQDPDKLREEMTLISGKAAGICYMPDDYLEEGIQNEEKALKRAIGTSKSGHHSVYDHGHVTFIIKTSKMMAMILNSLGVYATSEKSARYTAMKASTEIEDRMYTKWTGKLEEIIAGYYSDSKDSISIHKLAMENARYMLSVFTGTVLEYTVSYRQAILITNYLDKMYEENWKDSFADNAIGCYYREILTESKSLSESIKNAIGTDAKEVLRDNKNQGIRFIENFYNKISLKSLEQDTDTNDEKLTCWFPDEMIYKPKDVCIGDSYTLVYPGSFAMLAQAQRHRTIRYSFFIDNYDIWDFYVPEIIKNSPLECEWISDMKQLVNSNVTPQGLLVRITEQGIFEDFALKCKERLCSRAQLEICISTSNSLKLFIKNESKLGFYNKLLVRSMTGCWCTIKPRCGFSDFKCMEPCPYGKNGLIRNI